MNYFIFIALSLITINASFAMDATKKITIHNKTHNTIILHFTFYNAKTSEKLPDSMNKLCSSLFIDNQQQLNPREQQQFNLEIPGKFLNLQPTLEFQNTNPHKINLNIGPDNLITYGDTLTIKRTKGSIIISNQNNKFAVLLPETNKPFSKFFK